MTTETISQSDVPTPPEVTAPVRKPRASRTLPAAKRAARRLKKLLDGVKKWKQEPLFKGPLAWAPLNQLLVDFDATCASADKSLLGRKNASADATVILRRGQAVVDEVQGFADLYYDYGTAGRSLFFAVGGKTSVADELDACLEGLKADRTDTKDAAGKKVDAPHLIPLTPDTDLATVQKLAVDVRAAQTLAAQEVEGRTALTTKRETLGEQVHKVTPRVEALVRRLNKDTPARMADYGVKPR